MTDSQRRARRISAAFVVLTLIFLAVLIGFGIVIHNVQNNSSKIKGLVVENTNRIHDIQRSRVESCQRTYEGIRQVFKPFFPDPPRTQKQIDDLEKFNTLINKLKNKCDQQTHTSSVPRGGNS
jgi:hypothetical protein